MDLPGRGMKKVVPLILAAVVGLYQPGDTAAQQGPPDGRSRGGDIRPGGPGGGFMYGRRLRNDDLSDAEKTVILDFVKEHSPQRWKAFEEISNPDFKARVERMIIARNRVVLATQNRGESELFGLLVARVEAEDEAWGLSRQLRDKPEGEDAESAKAALLVIAQRLVDLELQEREIRIARLREMVARQEQNLEEDKKDLTKAVEQRYSELLSGETRPGPAIPGGVFPGHPGNAPPGMMPPGMPPPGDGDMPPPPPPPPPGDDAVPPPPPPPPPGDGVVPPPPPPPATQAEEVPSQPMENAPTTQPAS